MQCLIPNRKRKRHKSLNTKNNIIGLIVALPSDNEDIPYLDDHEFQVISEPKTSGEKRNGVSTPLVLSMRPHAHKS